MLLLALFVFGVTASCLPFLAGNTTTGIGQSVFDEAYFKGIDWSVARKAGNCNEDQLDKHWQASKIALGMVDPMTFGQLDDNNAWDWFFKSEGGANEDKGNCWRTKGDVRNFCSVGFVEALIQSKEAHKAVYKRIVNNMELPYPFILHGKRLKTTDVKTNKLIYSCKESRPGTKGNCKANTAAYTSRPDESETGKWMITFCKKFWDDGGCAEDLFDHDKYRYRKPADFNRLQPYERTISHEWFRKFCSPQVLVVSVGVFPFVARFMVHWSEILGLGLGPVFNANLLGTEDVDWMGFSNFANPTADAPHIIDEEEVLSDGTVQQSCGATLANQFAWAKQDGVELRVATNADTYALYFLSK